MSNRCYILRSKNDMFGPIVAISRFYHLTHLRLFYTICMAAFLMRRSRHQNPCWSILPVYWVNHIIIHESVTLYYQKQKQETRSSLPREATCSIYIGAWLNFMSLPSSLGVVSVDGLCVTWVDLVIAFGGWKEKSV